MKPSLLASRSVAAEFANRLYLPIFIITLIGAVVLLGISIYLVTLSAWWVILLVFVSVAILLAAGGLTVAWVFIKIVTPLRSKQQKQQTKQFVDKLQRVAEVATTPKFVLFFQVMRDVVNPRQDGYIISATTEVSSLKNDFTELKNSFGDS